MTNHTLASDQCLSLSGPLLHLYKGPSKDFMGVINTSMNYFHFSEMVMKEWYELGDRG